MSKRGSESEKRAYAKGHRNDDRDQHTAHYYSHEINSYIKGNMGKSYSIDHYVDHSDNFRMVTAKSNQGKHRIIDNDFIRTDSHSNGHYWKNPDISTSEYQARFTQQIQSLKESGGLNDRHIYSFYKNVADAYGFDRRCMKGSEWYGQV